ncbi:zinc finger protein ZAT5-like [Nicotiana tabacum]|uniref:Zinc finger protein ZAT5-like n=1 Tax=Nicotiana tabacum TaxID=4097 RepID=A0A1S3Y7N4_TOBAC|nr:PREDICTED: zinc finger protein ZAT5-like [Nicotiana tabacum]
METSQDFPERSYAFKGKRSKRSRPSSPLDIAGTMVTSSSSAAGGSDDGGGDVYYSSAIVQYSPTTSTTQISTTCTSEEDEDMANCLILLAQSGRRKVQVVTEVKKEKISSRKFTEMVNTTTGKAGFFVYECKTCNRTFPSFQALGGHRASHKRPKTIVEEKKSVTIPATATATAMASASTAMATARVGADSLVENHNDRHIENDQEEGRFNKISSPSFSVQMVNNNNNKGIISHGNSNSKPKIHECSICGSEFSSGQALGGHMRKHKPPTTATVTNTKVSTNTHIETISNFSESSHDVGTNYKEEEKSTRNFLSLDLNLPAPPEDDRRETKFEQSLVFSAAPLVDCHY